MERTRIMVEYIIYSEDYGFNPDEATKALGIKPDIIRKKGELIKQTELGKIYSKDNSWLIKTQYEESINMYHQLNKIIDRIKGKENIICKLHEKYNTSNYFCVVIEVGKQGIPFIDIEQHLINYLNSIKAIIRFDPYILTD